MGATPFSAMQGLTSSSSQVFLLSMTVVAKAVVEVTFVQYDDSECSLGAKAPYVHVYTNFPTTSQRCARISSGDHILISEECLHDKVVTTFQNCGTWSLCSQCSATEMESYPFSSMEFDKFLAGQGQ